MVYETKLPRQASTSTVTEDFSEDSEVPCETQRAGDWSNGLRTDKIGGSGWVQMEQAWAVTWVKQELQSQWSIVEKDRGWVTRVNNQNGEWEENALEQDREETINFYLLSWHHVIEIVESCMAVVRPVKTQF